MNRSFLNELAYACVGAILASHCAFGQYSQGARELRRAADQYDARGRGSSGALTVDGHVAVAPINGAVSYSYPIASRTIGGFAMDVRLNYCPSVNFTTYGTYSAGSQDEPQARWSRFSQNRAAWLIGVNGFAVQALATTTSYHSDTRRWPGKASFDDRDVVWTIDGYDVCNRMEQLTLGTAIDATTFVDVIRLLRDDGSTLELVNVKRHTTAAPTSRADLYTGHYFVNEVNARGYGIVEFDSTYWPTFLRTRAENLARYSNPTYPFIPRLLRYFPGDGLEYLFREVIAPFGLGSYTDSTSTFGGMHAGPTIFYLEEIRSNGALLTRLSRSRHHTEYSVDGITTRLDSTRGRALFTDMDGVCHIEYGARSLLLEALGRTTRVQFEETSPSGTATASQLVPLAQFGYRNRWSDALAAVSEANAPYESIVGYVSQIVDPEGRVTRFGYETYTRRYQGFGFPAPGATVTLSLSNKRLSLVEEPSTRTVICYHDGDLRQMLVGNECTWGNSDMRLVAGAESAENPSALSNMVRFVRRYDVPGTLLTTDEYTWSDFDDAGRMFRSVWQTTTDAVTSARRVTRFGFRRNLLANAVPAAPPTAFTEMRSVELEADEHRTLTTTTYERPSPSRVFWLPSAVNVHVNGVRKSSQRFEYTTDTVRRYGEDAGITSEWGREVSRRIVRSYGASDRLLTIDTTYYRHFPRKDTIATWIDSAWKKRESLQRYLSLSTYHPDIRGRRWEEVLYHPLVAVYAYDTITGPRYRTPVFGAEVRHVIADEGGRIRSGTVRVLAGDTEPCGSPRLPSLVLADSTIGDGGRTMPAATYTYGRHWMANLRTGVTNANGATTAYSYEQWLGRSAPYAPTAADVPVNSAGILSGDDSVVAHSMIGMSPELVELPHAELSLVRRLQPDASVREDTIARLYERTYFGEVSGMREPAGWYTRYSYDRNGRLLRVWHPGDFPRASAQDTFFTERADSIELYGATVYTRRVDTLACLISSQPPQYPRVIGVGLASVVTTEVGRLYAGLPVLIRPRCPCGDTAELRSEKIDAALLRSCLDTVVFEAIGEGHGYTGLLSLRLRPGGLFESLARLDSALLRLRVADVEGECVTVTIELPRFGFSRSYSLNCPSEKQTPDRVAPGWTGPSLLVTASGLPRVEEGPYLDVRLDSITAQLAALRTGDTFSVCIRVSTPGGGVRFSSGADAADVRPRLVLFGRYRTPGDDDNYTLAYRHDDVTLATEVLAKTDDIHHTVSPWSVTRTQPSIRRSRIINRFGADYRHLGSEITIGVPTAPLRVDTIRSDWTGAGLRRSLVDQLGDAIVTRHDGLGRPVLVTNQDGSTSSIRYLAGTPADCGITDNLQDFGGFCSATITTDENGVRRVRYTDAFDRLRREVIAQGVLDFTTRMEYDLLGRLTSITGPTGQTTSYEHDPFGRVAARANPNVGRTTYAHDRVGNLRFSQSQDQAMRDAVTFTEYDDLNRVTLIGEASIESVPAARRLTDTIVPTRTNHTFGPDSTVTINPTVLLAPVGPVVPGVWSYESQVPVTTVCVLRPSVLMRELSAPVPPYIAHPATHPEPVMDPRATVADFENVARYPHFVRVAIAYDALPLRLGAIWSGMPAARVWDSLAPRGRVRNTRGRETAVAWREHGGEAFNYAVQSYDERGRIEALLRYTDNVGFDAVYYAYNALNQATIVRVADPLNQHTTWYGHDANGRIDSVWTLLEPGRGLGLTVPRRPRIPARPERPDIVHEYNRAGRVSTVSFPPAATAVSYSYNRRSWIDSIVAARTVGDTSVPLFREQLKRDPAGQLIEQRTQHGNGGVVQRRYAYDASRRLVGALGAPGVASWTLDAAGNRRAATSPRGWNRTQYTYAGAGPDWMTTFTAFGFSGWRRIDQLHDLDGAVIARMVTDSSRAGIVTAPAETYAWSYRELLQRYTYNGTASDWRYRYSPAGEREQKRKFPSAPGHAGSDNENPWVYYLLGADREQLAEWHGREVNRSDCGGTPVGSAWMYPVAYLSKGGGLTRVATRPDAAVASGRKEFYVADHLGSTRLVVGIGGAVVEEIDYEPFGTPSMGPTATREAFTGRETDPENGLADHGIRKYDAVTGRFLSVDPSWDAAQSVTPYHYAHSDPLNRADPNGRWDIVIHVAKDQSLNGYGIAVVTNRKGEEVFRFAVRLSGVGNRRRYGSATDPHDRLQQYSDTPLGVYDIPDGKAKWITGKSRTAYGPNPRLRLDPFAGEIVLSGRTDIRIHGGRQETVRDGEIVARAEPTLEKTHGCIRAFDNAMKQLKEITDQLERDDPQEHGGQLIIVDDLITADGTPVPASDLINGTGER